MDPRLHEVVVGLEGLLLAGDAETGICFQSVGPAPFGVAEVHEEMVRRGLKRGGFNIGVKYSQTEPNTGIFLYWNRFTVERFASLPPLPPLPPPAARAAAL